MDILNILLEISIYSAVIYLAITLLKKVFNNKMSPALHYAVWALMVIRLIMPFTIDSNVKLFVIPQTQEQQEASASEAAAVNGVLQEDITDKPSYAANEQIFLENEANTVTPSVSAATAAESEKAAPSWSIGNILIAVWFTGVGAALIYIAFSYLALKRRIRLDVVPATKHVQMLFEECKRELGIGRSVKVTGVYNLGTPALIIPSTVLIPMELLVSMNDTQIKYALRHELTHYKRKDHVICMLLLLLQAAYWFNPFVWLAFRQIRTDMEVACDSAVVKRLGDNEKCSYANMIVSMFAQRRNKQLVLGMAQGDTKNVAEQRVRGIFMNAKSKKSGKLVATLLAAILLMTCFTTACQPTPEEPIVYQKTQVYQESEAARMTKQDMDVPDHVEETDELSDKLTLKIDADVTVPGDIDSYKVYRGGLTGFTQEQVDSFADLLVGDTPLTGYDDRYTKDEITEYFLLPAQQTLAELKAGTYIQDPNMDGDIPTIESMEEIIEMHKQWIEEAPEKRSNDAVSARSYTANGNYIYGEFPIEGSKITGKFMVGEDDRNRYGGLSFYNCGYDLMEPHNVGPDPFDLALPEEGLDLQMTQEEAIRLATELKVSLGADELDFYAIMQARAWVEEMGTGKIDAYYVVFTRRFDDVPGLYIRGVAAESGYNKWQTFEKLIVTIDDSGVIVVNWMGNTEITDVINDNPEFISFDKILSAAKNQVNSIYSYMPENGEDIENKTVTISSVSLEYLRMKEPNGSDSDVRFVPAWVFCGTEQRTYTDEAIEKNEYLREKVVTYDIRTPIVINALDGSAFNPRYLDGIEPVYEGIKPDLPDTN